MIAQLKVGGRERQPRQTEHTALRPHTQDKSTRHKINHLHVYIAATLNYVDA